MHSAKHRRGPWSQAEDNYLLQLVQTQGAHNWVRISQLITSRSPKQCRERYHQNLKPSLNLDPITPDEGVMIERMVAEMGKRWAEIARRLHGRSDNAVKNWWNGGMNRRKRLETRRSDLPRPYRPAADDDASFYRPAYDAPYMSRSATHYSHLPTPLDLAAYRGLPSPTASSVASRPDSTHGHAPSLVSDRSCASCTQSPCASPRVDRLPPLKSAFADALPAQVQVRPSYDSHWQHAAAPVTAYPTIKPLARSASPLPFGGQLPLPAFSTIRVPEYRAASPPRDSRMSLNNMIH